MYHVTWSCGCRDVCTETHVANARREKHVRNARADLGKHQSRDRAIVHHMIVRERKYFVVYRHEHSIEKDYAQFLNVSLRQN